MDTADEFGFGEIGMAQFNCLNPICIRIHFISYINECPTCGFSGVVRTNERDDDE